MKLANRGFPILNESSNTYTYVDQPFNTAPNQTSQVVDTTGIYLSVRYNSCGGYSLDQIEIEYHPFPNFTINQTPNLCSGDSTGSMNVTYTGSNINSYLWNTGEITSSIDSLPLATYYVTVTGNHCTLVDSATLNDPLPITSNFTVTNSYCTDENNGTIFSNTTGGTQPYFYSINGIANSNGNIDNLSPGNYTVITSDYHNCKQVDRYSH